MTTTDTDRRRRLLRLEADELALRVRDLQVRLEVELDRTLARFARDAATILEDLVDVLDG